MTVNRCSVKIVDPAAKVMVSVFSTEGLSSRELMIQGALLLCPHSKKKEIEKLLRGENG